MKNPSRRFLTLAVSLLTVLATENDLHAQVPHQASVLTSSSWSGTVTWTDGGGTDDVVLEFSQSGDGMVLKMSGAADPCLDVLTQLQWLSDKSIAFLPASPERCKKPIKIVSVSRASETEIGMLVMSELDALSQGAFVMDNPTAEQLEDRDTLKRPLPESLDGYFRVSESGLLLRLVRVEGKGDRNFEVLRYQIVEPDAFAEDAGQVPGDVYGRGSYLPLLGDVTMADAPIVLPEERAQLSHCPPLFMPATDHQIANARRAQRSVTSVPMLTMSPRSDRVCTSVSTNVKTCRIVSCTEYETKPRKHSLLLRDEVVARQLARVARSVYEPDESYADLLEEMRQRASRRKVSRQRATTGESKGYFDRGGACGPISCEEEDTLQFLVDQYW
ncbi:MAG: hypothetical protein AAFQ99_05675 [Pseudomonadota bacterium]